MPGYQEKKKNHRKRQNADWKDRLSIRTGLGYDRDIGI